MKANEVKIERFFSSNNTQFVIPVYQRNYDWTTGQCKQLLDDIFEVGENKKKDKIDAHFIGSIVYVQDDVYTTTKINELIIIDGQQRLTTLTLIYLVLYRLAKKLNNEKLASEIRETYLINKFASDQDNLKLRPTENNNKALQYLLRDDENEKYQDYSRLINNFNYFYSRITEINYQIVMDGLLKLMFVEIALERKDNPQRIFESLNSTGLELSQGDLIRNYILMAFNGKEQKTIYNNYWKYIEDLAKDETQNASRVSDFIRDYLTLENKKIPNKGKVYEEFKAKYSISILENKIERDKFLSRVKLLVNYYNKLINPDNEKDKEIKTQLKYINRLKIDVAYPFLIKVYEDYANKSIDKSTFISVLELIQSFVWRRAIIQLPTNSLNKIFMNLYEKVDINNYLFSLQKSLLQRSGSQRFPKNEEILNTLKERDIYNMESKNRTYLFERLENFENKETVVIEGNKEITIEHIFPQNPDAQWKIELGNDDYKFIRDNYLNTIGNLTLSGNNGKLGNKPFKEKRDLENTGYKDSRLWLNKYLANAQTWGKEQIEERSKVLSERFLKIWPRPNIDIEEDIESSEINIFEAEDPTFKKLKYAIFLNEKIEVREVAKLYVEVIKQLFELRPETLLTSDIGMKIGLTKNPIENNLRQPIAINDTYFIEGNLGNVDKFERIKQVLTLFNYEDELTIKYAES